MFSPVDSLPQRIVSCSNNKNLHLYNAQTGDLIQKMSGHRSGVWTIAFSGNGTRIASGDSLGRVMVWDGLTGALLNRMDNFRGSMLHLFFTGRDRFVCCHTLDSAVIGVCDIVSGETTSAFTFNCPISTLAVSYTSPDCEAREDFIVCGWISKVHETCLCVI